MYSRPNKCLEEQYNLNAHCSDVLTLEKTITLKYNFKFVVSWEGSWGLFFTYCISSQIHLAIVIESCSMELEAFCQIHSCWPQCPIQGSPICLQFAISLWTTLYRPQLLLLQLIPYSHHPLYEKATPKIPGKYFPTHLTLYPLIPDPHALGALCPEDTVGSYRRNHGRPGWDTWVFIRHGWGAGGWLMLCCYLRKAARKTQGTVEQWA